jgi:hypothetical protein
MRGSRKSGAKRSVTPPAKRMSALALEIDLDVTFSCGFDVEV